MTIATRPAFITPENLLSLSTVDIMQVYVSRKGKAHGCYCGCNGSHRYNSYHAAAASKSRGYPVTGSDINDRQVAKVLGIVQEAFKANPESVTFGGDFKDDKNYTNVTFVMNAGNPDDEKSYTLYNRKA